MNETPAWVAAAVLILAWSVAALVLLRDVELTTPPPPRQPYITMTCGSREQTVYNDEGDTIGCIRYYE